MKEPFPRQIIATEDGSQTLFIPALNEQYHSIHGALQESNFVFIKNGLSLFQQHSCVRIFEVGFGTGLNALVTMNYIHNLTLKVIYHSIEKYPLSKEEYSILNYSDIVAKGKFTDAFLNMHSCTWNESCAINNQFILKKINSDLNHYCSDQEFDLVYFDAFAPDIQPDLWTVEVFEKMYKILSEKGILVTYSAKGQVRRNMQQAGFKVERLPGPPGKREMLRACKS